MKDANYEKLLNCDKIKREYSLVEMNKYESI